jgi:hypothetical protein
MSENTKLPNEELTEIIADKLMQKKLVPLNRLDELKRLISQGNVKQEDWRSCVELNLSVQEKEHRNE